MNVIHLSDTGAHMHFQIVWLMPLKLFSCCVDTHSDPISLIFNRERTNRFLRWLMLRFSPMSIWLPDFNPSMVAQLWLRPRLPRGNGMRIPQPRALTRLSRQPTPSSARQLHQLGHKWHSCRALLRRPQRLVAARPSRTSRGGARRRCRSVLHRHVGGPRAHALLRSTTTASTADLIQMA